MSTIDPSVPRKDYSHRESIFNIAARFDITLGP
jgi:hypothetical protein